MGVLLFGSAYAKYDAVTDEECIGLVRLCAVTPEGEEYRRKVIHLGREFVRAEYEMMEKWNDGIDGRAARKALYRNN